MDPETLFVIEGHDVVMNWPVSANPPATVTWFKDNRPVDPKDGMRNQDKNAHISVVVC